VNVVEAVNIPNLDWRSLLSKPDTFIECALLQYLYRNAAVCMLQNIRDVVSGCLLSQGLMR
jgi:hypothetical protein